MLLQTDSSGYLQCSFAMALFSAVSFPQMASGTDPRVSAMIDMHARSDHGGQCNSILYSKGIYGLRIVVCYSVYTARIVPPLFMCWVIFDKICYGVCPVRRFMMSVQSGM